MKLHSPPFFLTGILPTSESGCKHLFTGINDVLLEHSARSGTGYLLQNTPTVQLGNAASIFISINTCCFLVLDFRCFPQIRKKRGKKRSFL